MSLVKDNGFSLSGKIGGISGGIKFADNALTCDSEGNCMLKDELWCGPICKYKLKKAAKLAEAVEAKDNLGGVSVGFGKAKVGVNWADSKDNGNFSVGIGGAKVGFGWADNALTCDSEGNCMLKDNLGGVSVGFGKAKVGVNWADSKDNGGVSVGFGGAKVGVNWADSKDNGGVSVGFGGAKVGVNWADSKDNGGFSLGVGGAKVGVNWADNSLTCDSAGNCMLKDNLGMFKSIANVAGTKVLPMATGYATGGAVKAKVSFADNALTCDSEGNCMLKDDLWKAKGCIGKLCAGISNKLADNALTCDSEGNCMLKDDLIKIGGSIGGVSASMKF